MFLIVFFGWSYEWSVVFWKKTKEDEEENKEEDEEEDEEAEDEKEERIKNI